MITKYTISVEDMYYDNIIHDVKKLFDNEISLEFRPVKKGDSYIPYCKELKRIAIHTQPYFYKDSFMANMPFLVIKKSKKMTKFHKHFGNFYALGYCSETTLGIEGNSICLG